MTDAPYGASPARRSPSLAGIIFRALFLLVGAVIAGALLMIALDGSQRAMLKPAGPIGSIQAVTLLNGQVYFDTLNAEEPGRIILVDVFDLLVTVDQKTNQRTTQVVRRRTGNVHGPIDMVIPTDKILFTESVGKGSGVANAIANLDAAPLPATAPTSTPPAAAPTATPAPAATPPAAPDVKK